MTGTPKYTPWGAAQQETVIADGIIKYNTAGHGGYYLSEQRREEFAVLFPTFAPWAGSPWFEEDCDWALVTVAFPDHFDDEDVYNAVRSIEHTARPCGEEGSFDRTYSGQFVKVLAAIPAATRARAEAFKQAKAHLWQTGSMGTYTGDRVWVAFGRIGDGAQRKAIFAEWPTKSLYTEEEITALTVG